MGIAACPIYGYHRMVGKGMVQIVNENKKKLNTKYGFRYFSQCDCGTKVVCSGFPQFGDPIENWTADLQLLMIAGGITPYVMSGIQRSRGNREYCPV